MYDFLFAGLGLIILILGGDALVRGAVNLALRLGIPALIVSLTIVAFGTSAPELLIAVDAVLLGSPGLAIGNVVGSNVANILLVLGLPALLAGLNSSQCETARSYSIMLVASVFFYALCLTGALTWIHGLLLLAALAVVLFDTFRQSKLQRSDNSENVEGADASMPPWLIGLLIAVGIIGLPLGANILVDSATNIARSFGVSDEIIGLTLIAVGTSLPELATTIMAAFRGKADVALGNVIGSNLFNLLAILGVASLVGTIPIPTAFIYFDLPVMILASFLIAPVVFKRLDLGRRWGLALTVLYTAYVVALLVFEA